MKISKVTLRKKLLKDGKNESLYLDFYPPITNPINGKQTRREYLRMYTFTKPKDELEKTQNKNILLRARKICNERQNLIYSNDYGFLASELDNNCYLEYFNSLALKCGKSTSNQQKWLVVLKYLKEYSEEIKMKDLTIHFVHGFKDFLLNKAHFRKKGEKISQNSASSYFSKVIYSLKCAYKEGLLRDNLAPKIDRVKAVEVKKAFLTKEEATKLKQTYCKDEQLKKACLFMMYTGLRVSDIMKLKWSEIEYSSETGYFIRFKHQKTGHQQTLPFSADAYNVLPRQGVGNEGVFNNFTKNYRLLKVWAKDVGITKNIGFHTFRHTFATMLLNSDVSVFTVQQMLGHKEISTTMNYVNLLNDKKVSAANAIKF